MDKNNAGCLSGLFAWNWSRFDSWAGVSGWQGAHIGTGQVPWNPPQFDLYTRAMAVGRRANGSAAAVDWNGAIVNPLQR